MKVEIFTHKNCTECNLLLEYLDQKGLLGRVQIIDTELYPFLALERGVISTPSVFIDGKLVYAGTVDFQEFEKLLQGEKIVKKINKDELVDKLMYGIVDSFAATAWLYVNLDFDSFMAQKDFVMAVTGLVFSEDAEELYNYLRNLMIKNGLEYVKKWEDKMLRNISSNFVREIYWLYGSKLSLEQIKAKYPLEVFAHWLMVRGGSTGRVGLRIHPLTEKDTMERISKAYMYMINNYDQLWEKVEKEQKSLKSIEVERKAIL
ncbi:thioredoxin family protein [Acidianus ambivalens]|uniref:Thioredoxin n=1 Tax=Acidianus ambivalens TaxID=2283 RepID=A0A650CSI1_ACIAM|nr:thioredoxin family protein [Acidianus ambivalens]MQL55198.1 thioredoxin [Acidianus ambivalens]QGR20743.1 thioredoxin [Acidianus ambivalens]